MKNIWISIKTSLKFVAKGPVNDIPALVQIRTWRRSGDKSSSEPMIVSFASLGLHELITYVRIQINKMLSIYKKFHSINEFEKRAWKTAAKNVLILLR